MFLLSLHWKLNLFLRSILIFSTSGQPTRNSIIYYSRKKVILMAQISAISSRFKRKKLLISQTKDFGAVTGEVGKRRRKTRRLRLMHSNLFCSHLFKFSSFLYVWEIFFLSYFFGFVKKKKTYVLSSFPVGAVRSGTFSTSFFASPTDQGWEKKSRFGESSVDLISFGKKFLLFFSS